MNTILPPHQTGGDSVWLPLGVLLRALPVIRKYCRGSKRLVPLLRAAGFCNGMVLLHLLFVSRV
ncbi:MAG TPA: hypothetical protein VI136_09675 [Verrucomicrobiae bacterium]